MPWINQILDVSRNGDNSKHQISWSDTRILGLRAMANGEGLRSPLDDKLASAILLCVEGRFADAQKHITRLMTDNVDLVNKDAETFISVLFALYVAQEFGLVAALLNDRFGFNADFSIDVEDNGPGVGRIRWEISKGGIHRFVFDAKSYQYDKTRDDILGFYWEFPLYANFSRSAYREHGEIVINQMDVGFTPGLAWCDNRPNYFLVPDCIFVPSRGYQWAREVFKRNYIPWDQRKDIAFWRGGTTGVPNVPGDWRSLERIALCEIARKHEHLGLFDVGLSSIVQLLDAAAVKAVENSGLMRNFVSWEQWGNFKYHIDIDGNSSPWSNLFQRLLTGSPVLKVESSRCLQQWFYDKLEPWVNYIPIAPNMSDLLDKVQWLRANQSYARNVGEAGRCLAMRLTYERELGRSADTVARAFRYFRDEPNCSSPFGRAPCC